MHRHPVHYLILPGWQGSPAEHWQSHWQQVLPDASRVEQDDWLAPRRADWVARLDRQVASAPSRLILIAHSLGCVTVAHWAAHAAPELLSKVQGALLVAPADVERPDCPAALRDFAPIPNRLLPFASLLIGSDNDPAVSATRALQLARLWGAESLLLAGAGHINVKSGHRQWEQGFAHLFRLQSLIEQRSRRLA